MALTWLPPLHPVRSHRQPVERGNQQWGFLVFQPHFLWMFILGWNRGREDKKDSVIAKSVQMFVCTSFSTCIAPDCVVCNYLFTF